MRSLRAWKIVLLTLAIALIGGLLYWGITTQYAYRTAISALREFHNAFRVTPYSRYGVVESVDPQAGTITMRMLTIGENAPITIRMRVAENAFIAEQWLIGSNGVYTGLTERTPALLSDIEAGMRASILSQIIKGETIAFAIIFGNPL